MGRGEKKKLSLFRPLSKNSSTGMTSSVLRQCHPPLLLLVQQKVCGCLHQQHAQTQKYMHMHRATKTADLFVFQSHLTPLPTLNKGQMKKALFFVWIASFCWQMLPNGHSFLKIPRHATFTAVLTSDGGVCESWPSWELLRLVWGSRRAESWGTHWLACGSKASSVIQLLTPPHADVHTPSLSVLLIQECHSEDDGITYSSLMMEVVPHISLAAVKAHCILNDLH